MKNLVLLIVAISLLLAGCVKSLPKRVSSFQTIETSIISINNGGFDSELEINARHKKAYNRIKELLESNVNPNDFDSKDSPLTISIYKGYDDISQLLIDYGAEVKVKSSDVPTPLIIVAVKKGLIGTVKKLIAKNVDLNAEDIHGKSAMDYIDSASVSLSMIYDLVDAGAKLNVTNNRNSVIDRLWSLYEVYGDEVDLIKIAYLGAGYKKKGVQSKINGYILNHKSKYISYKNYFNYSCRLSNTDWTVSNKLCRSDKVNGNSSAFNRYTLATYKGVIKDGHFIFGSLFENGKLVYTGSFRKGQYHEGIIYSEGQTVFKGKLKGKSYLFGTLYSNGKPFFKGSFKYDEPIGKGTCFYNGKKETCNYRDSIRIDRFHLARLKKKKENEVLEKLKYCQSNPMPVEDVVRLNRDLKKPCNSEVRVFESAVNEYNPKRYTTRHIHSNYKKVGSCIDNLDNRYKRLSKKSKYYAYIAKQNQCKSNDTVFHNIEVFKQDINSLGRGIDFAISIGNDASDAADEVQGIKNSYESAKKSRERSQLLGVIVSGISQFRQEYSRLQNQRATQLNLATRRNNEMARSAENWGKKNQERFKQGLGGISGSKYRDTSSSITASSIKQQRGNLNSSLKLDNKKTSIKVADAAKTKAELNRRNMLNKHGLRGCSPWRGGVRCLNKISGVFISKYEPNKVCMRLEGGSGTIYMKPTQGRPNNITKTFSVYVIIKDGQRELNLDNGYHMYFQGMPDASMEYEIWYPSQGRYGVWDKVTSCPS